MLEVTKVIEFLQQFSGQSVEVDLEQTHIIVWNSYGYAVACLDLQNGTMTKNFNEGVVIDEQSYTVRPIGERPRT